MSDYKNYFDKEDQFTLTPDSAKRTVLSRPSSDSKAEAKSSKSC